MNLLSILLGIISLTLGRRVFWFFVGVIGFAAGVILARRFFPGQSDLTVLVIALGAGLAGSVLALALQGLAIWVAGFLAGGYLANALIGLVGGQTGQLTWISFVIGGILGAILMFVLFDWALIILSSLTGASLIVQNIQMPSQLEVLAFLALLAAGILIQAQGLPGMHARRGR
jgi:hypothetical protein